MFKICKVILLWTGPLKVWKDLFFFLSKWKVGNWEGFGATRIENKNESLLGTSWRNSCEKSLLNKFDSFRMKRKKLIWMYLVKRPPFPGRRYFRFGWWRSDRESKPWNWKWEDWPRLTSTPILDGASNMQHTLDWTLQQFQWSVFRERQWRVTRSKIPNVQD